MKTKSFFILSLAATISLQSVAQENRVQKADKSNETEIKGQNSKDNNMMLNAADETSASFIRKRSAYYS